MCGDGAGVLCVEVMLVCSINEEKTDHSPMGIHYIVFHDYSLER